MNIINLEELEKITEKLYGPKQDSSLIDYANAFKENYINNINFQELFGFFITSRNQHCLFFLLDTLTNLINLQYKNFSDEYKQKFRDNLIFIIENYTEKIFIANFIETKFCVLFLNWIKHDYPENWPTLFKDLIALIFSTQDANIKMLKVTLLIDLLLTFDEEMIKFRHTYTEYEGVRSTRIKDYMRLEAVSECVFVINQLMQNEKHFSKKLINSSIKVIAQLIDWNSLNLFADSIKIITTNLIGQLDYECGSLEILNAIISKGMEPIQKIELIKFLSINETITNLLKNTQNITAESLFNICEIVGNIGTFTVEAFEMVKSITKGEVQIDVNVHNSQDLFNYVCELTNYAISHSITIIKYSFKLDVKIALNLVDFISNFTTYLKSNEFLANTLNEIIQSLARTIESYLKIPTSQYDIRSMTMVNDDEDFFSFRKEFTILYLNFFYLNSLKTMILTSIIGRLEKTSLIFSQSPGQLYPILPNDVLSEVELTLHLAHTIQGAINNNDFQNLSVSDYFNKLIYLLFSVPFCNVNSDIIVILYYDTVYKYIQYIINNENTLVYVSKLYLSKRGIMHDNPVVGSRICISFDKFVDKVKTQLGKLDIIYEISEALKNFIQYLCTENKNLYLVSEYNVLFKTLCITILQKNFNEERKYLLFKDVLSIFDSIFINFGLDSEKFIEASKCITNFIKNIGFELSPNIKLLFIEYFSNFINNIYLKIQKNSKIDYSMITILQRLINILGKDSLQYLEYFITEQIKFPEADMYEDSSKLLQNATQILKKESKGLIQNCFYFFYKTIINIKLPETNISEIDKNILSYYQNFIKLIANMTIEMVEVFFENGGLKNVDLEELINFMIYIGRDEIDPNQKRSIVKSLKAILLQITKVITSSQQMDEGYLQSLLNLVQIILSGTFQIYVKLNLSDPIDFNTIPEIVQIHFYVLKEGLQNYYLNYIANFLDQENIIIFTDHLNVYDVKKFKVGDMIMNYFNFISANNFNK